MADAALERIEARLKEASSLVQAGKHAEAEAGFREALRQLDAAGLDFHPLRGYAFHSLRHLYRGQRRFPEAVAAGTQEVALLERHFGPEDPRLADPVEGLATAHYHARQYDAASGYYERALALYRRGGPPAERRLAETLPTFGKCLQRQEKLPEAAAQYTEALALQERLQAPPLLLADTLYHLGTVLALQGHPARAEGYLVRALNLCRQSGGGPLELLVLSQLVRVMEAGARHQEAEGYARLAVERAESAAPEGHPARADALRDLGRTLAAQHRTVEALPVLERALAAAEQAYGPQSPFTAACLHNLAGACFRAGDVDRAGALDERAVAVYQLHGETVAAALADTFHCLAQVRERQGRPAEARELAARAHALGAGRADGPAGTLSIALPRADT